MAHLVRGLLACVLVTDRVFSLYGYQYQDKASPEKSLTTPSSSTVAVIVPTECATLSLEPVVVGWIMSAIFEGKVIDLARTTDGAVLDLVTCLFNFGINLSYS